MHTAQSASRLTSAAHVALFLTLGVPLYLAPGFIFPFVSVRGLVFRALVAFAGLCVLLRALVSEQAERGRRDWTFVAFALLLAVTVVSAAFGYSWQRSVFGTLARLGGVWTLAHLFLLYVLLRVTFEEHHWRWYTRGVVGVGVAAAAYGLLQRYQVELGIIWEGSPIPPNGPLGNYGIFAGYLLFPIGVAALLAFRERNRRARVLAVASLLPLLAVLWLATNRSSLLGLLFGVVLASVAYSWFAKRARVLALLAVVGAVSLAGLVGSMRPGGALASLGPKMPLTVQKFIAVAPTATGVDRKLQWKASVLALRERPLLGYGPENHEIVWARHFDPAVYSVTEDQFWDRTHNAFYEALGTTGVLGMIALLVFWGVIVAAIESRRRETYLSDAQAAVLLGLQSAYVVYLWFWFFDLTGMTIWIGMAAFVASLGRSPLIALSGRRAWRRQSLVVGAAGVAVGAALIWTYAVSPLFTAWKLGQLQLAVDARSVRGSPKTLRDFRGQLNSTSPYNVPGVALFSRYLSALRPAFPALRENEDFFRELAPTLEQSLYTLERARAADPFNDRLMTVKTRTLLRASQFYGSPEIATRAEMAAKEEVALGPRRIGPRLVLAGILAVNGRAVAALAQTDTALMIFPTSADAHGVRASIYLGMGNPAAAAAELRAAMPPVDSSSFSPRPPRTDPTIVLQTAFALIENGDKPAAARLLWHYLTRWYGATAAWHGATASSPVIARLDRTAASIVPVLELTAGDSVAARAAALGFLAICERARPAIEEFLQIRPGSSVRRPMSVVSSSADPAVILADVTRACEPGSVR